jgi:hypothetical protein
MTTLRAAGFSTTDTAATVAQRTGMPVDRVLSQTGLRAPGDALADAALDAPFAFRDGYAAATQAAEKPAPGTSSSSSVSSSTGGLLRMRLDAAFDAKPAGAQTGVAQTGEAKPADAQPAHDPTSWGVPTSLAGFPHEGRFMGATLDALTKEGRVDDMARAQELVARLGVRPYVAGGDVQQLLFSTWEYLRARSGDAPAVSRLFLDALREPFTPTAPKAGTPLPERLDVSSLPTSSAGFQHDGQFLGAFLDALMKPGLVDSPRRVDDLVRRMGLSAEVAPDDSVELHLFSLVETVRARYGGMTEAARAIADALDPRP